VDHWCIPRHHDSIVDVAMAIVTVSLAFSTVDLRVTRCRDSVCVLEAS
jgi:hypothetical protein